MAIFAIIALGVGFFAGLKVTRQDMVAAVSGYLEEHSFYDLRLISTLGFEQEDVEALAAAEGAEAVEGTVSFDVIYQTEDGSQAAIKLMQLPERINTVKLTAGRMPEKSNECVIDSELYGEGILGQTIYLPEDNEQDTLDCFTHTQYTIVGLVQSSLYIQYERGNTSLGSGRLAGFAYLPAEGFDVEYFTDIYVTLAGDYDLYSDAYSDFMEAETDRWKVLAEQTANRRYQSILGDAREELAEARAEFEDKKSEGGQELAEAEEKLREAETELLDGEKALADAGTELADAERELADKSKELEDARITLAEKKQEFEEAEAELKEGIAKWKENDDAVEAGKRQLSGAYQELNSQRTQLEEQENGLKKQETQLQQAETQLTEVIRVLESTGQDASVQKAELAAVQAGLGAVKAGLAQLQGGYSQLQSAEAQLAEAEYEISQGDRQLSDLWWNTLVPAGEELEEGRQELADAEEEIRDGEQKIADARQELADAGKTLEEKKQELADAQAKYRDGQKEYEDASQEFKEKIADAEAELADAEEELADLEEPETYVLGRETNVGYVCFENDSGIVDGIANIFPVFFFLVAALVCITTMNRMVEEQRTQIGVLKALGYGEGVIMSKYIIYSGFAAVAGCVFGFAAGTWAFPKIIWFAYGIMYIDMALPYIFSWKLALLSMAVSLICSVGTTWFSCRVELSEAAAELMRPKAPKAGKRIFLEYLPLWKHLSFLRKVSLRNIFRYKKRLFMMIIGIGGCTALLVTGFGIKDSISDIAERQFEEIQIYDIGVDLKDEADQNMEEAFLGLAESGLKEYIGIMEKNMDLVAKGAVKSVYLVAGNPDRMGSFVNLHTEEGKTIPYPGLGEAVVSKKMAEDYGIRPGNEITLRDENMQSITLTVSGILENYLYNYVYISEETWESQTGEEPERKKVYLNLYEDSDAHALSAAVMQLEGISNVTVNADISQRVTNMMGSLDIIVLAVIFSAAGLAFVVLYNLTNINITERIREIATVKVLGFYKRETASYVFRENILLTVFGMLFGFVLGHFLHMFVMNEIKVDLVAFRIHVRPFSYFASGFLTLLFTWLVNRFMSRKLEGISMTESLKSVD